MRWVKMINRMRRKQEEAAPEPAATPEDIALLREIRDELKNVSNRTVKIKRHIKCRFYV
jgi:hypothetical protein